MIISNIYEEVSTVSKNFKDIEIPALLHSIESKFNSRLVGKFIVKKPLMVADHTKWIYAGKCIGIHANIVRPLGSDILASARINDKFLLTDLTITISLVILTGNDSDYESVFDANIETITLASSDWLLGTLVEAFDSEASARLFCEVNGGE